MADKGKADINKTAKEATGKIVDTAEAAAADAVQKSGKEGLAITAEKEKTIVMTAPTVGETTGSAFGNAIEATERAARETMDEMTSDLKGNIVSRLAPETPKTDKKDDKEKKKNK